MKRTPSGKMQIGRELHDQRDPLSMLTNKE
jgi:hypothetical protein